MGMWEWLKADKNVSPDFKKALESKTKTCKYCGQPSYLKVCDECAFVAIEAELIANKRGGI